MKKSNILTIIAIVIVTVVSYVGARAAFDLYFKSESIKVEALSSDFVWGDDVQFEVTLKGDEKELYVKNISGGIPEVTEVCQTGNRQFIITVRTELLDEPYYKAVLMYGDKNYDIELR